ncbi:MAG TPA: hypothetical protein DCO77_03205, partial [Nitrospiraceae bacterium]|nr:hypothetical protein [Nitrospiraceae bacterium]
VVLDIEKEEFEDALSLAKKKKRVKLDIDLTADDLKGLVDKFKAKVKQKTKRDFPEDPFEQLRMARDAVFNSWNNPRAITYR